MLIVSKVVVPSYLHESALYKSIDGDDEDDIFQVPDRHMKPDDSVESDEDVYHLLTTLRYWGVDSISEPLIDYLLHKDIAIVEPLLDEFGKDMQYVEAFIKMKKAKSVEKELAIAVTLGAISVIIFLREREKRLHRSDLFEKTAASKSYCCLAAKHGRMQCLLYLREHQFAWDSSTCACAAEGGHLSILQCLHAQGCPWDVDTCCAAATKGSLPCLQYAHEQGCPWDKWTCYYAAQNNHLPCLQYAVGRGCRMPQSAATIAAKKGTMECLHFLHEHGCPWEGTVTYQVAQVGMLESLRYIHEHGGQWHGDTCAFAAAAGQLECLRYAHEQGCEWSTRTTAAAAGAGQLACLIYAHQQGCEWSEHATHAAAAEGHFACLSYAVERGCPVSDTDMVVYEAHREEGIAGVDAAHLGANQSATGSAEMWPCRIFRQVLRRLSIL